MKNRPDPHKNKAVKILTQTPVYQGFLRIKRYKLQHRLFSGEWSPLIDRELSICQPVAAALPYDPYLDKVILIEQFRIGALQQASPWLLEAVAGFQEGNEQLEEVITRELKEEGNLVAKELYKIYDYWVSPGGSNAFLTLYCARVDASTAGGVYGLVEEGEDIFVHVMDSQEAFALLKKGKINNSMTIIALQWLQLNKSLLQETWTQ